MKPGFTALMHGFSRTGKTSSLKSLDRKTGRHIFMVDIPTLVFDEYHRARKHLDKEPVQLFNEANTILFKRISANSSVDKMNNSMEISYFTSLRTLKASYYHYQPCTN
jgi:hypothetical protein